MVTVSAQASNLHFLLRYLQAHTKRLVCNGLYGKSQNEEVLPRVESGLLKSESEVLTITL
jgi:hypothetical protein